MLRCLCTGQHKSSKLAMQLFPQASLTGQLLNEWMSSYLNAKIDKLVPWLREQFLDWARTIENISDHKAEVWSENGENGVKGEVPLALGFDCN